MMRYPFPTIQLRGLKPNMVCSIRALSGNLPKDIRHGLRRVLDACGIRLERTGDFSAQAVLLRAGPN